jgi:acyl-CoA thioester hydrolase
MLRVHPTAAGGEELAEGVVVVRHEVQYAAPLVFRMEPVNVELWATEIRAASFTLAYEVFDETPEGRRVYLRARTVLTPYVFETERPRRLTAEERSVLERFLDPDAPPPLRANVGVEEVPPERRHVYPCTVRFSDVDAYRHVNNVKYFEYYQEARIALMTMLGSSEAGPGSTLGVVVAQIDVDYRRPIFFREEPYAVETWVARVGRSSFTIDGQVLDRDQVLSRSRVVLVGFDAERQASRQLTDAERQALSGLPGNLSPVRT